jgi:hypothetical protein
MLRLEELRLEIHYQQQNIPFEGVVKSHLAPPDRVENVLECSFTTCKLRFCAHFRLARKHKPTFYDTLI